MEWKEVTFLTEELSPPHTHPPLKKRKEVIETERRQQFNRNGQIR